MIPETKVPPSPSSWSDWVGVSRLRLDHHHPGSGAAVWRLWTEGGRMTAKPVVITYQFDRCDECSGPLEHEDHLWGLCPACQAKDRIQPQSRRTRRGVMAGRRPKGDRA